MLQDGDLVVFESVAICLYLAEKYPEGGLIPADRRARTLMHQWIFFGVTELEPPLWRIDKHIFIYPEAKRLPADIALAREDYRLAAAVLDEAMTGSLYLAGDQFTLADIVVGYLLVWSGWEGMLQEFPHLARYVQRLLARPGVPEYLLTPPADITG